MPGEQPSSVHPKLPPFAESPSQPAIRPADESRISAAAASTAAFTTYGAANSSPSQSLRPRAAAARFAAGKERDPSEAIVEGRQLTGDDPRPIRSVEGFKRFKGIESPDSAGAAVIRLS
jgi:hypothetical protein